MTLQKFLQALVEHNKAKGLYQIQINSRNLEEKMHRNNDIEMGDMYFTGCSLICSNKTLTFNNNDRAATKTKEDGTNVYPMEINSSMYIELVRIAEIEDVKDFADWFEYPSSKVVNLYMISDMSNKNRNVVTIGFVA